MPYTYSQFAMHEADLQPVRTALYSPTGPGFFIFPAFLDAAQTRHLLEFWRNPARGKDYAPYVSKYGIFDGCPNYVLGGGRGNTSYCNFFWNRAADDLTYSVSMFAQLLRNRVEQRPVFRELFPLEQRSASFRVVISRNGRNLVAPHRDWLGRLFDARRTQMTIVLTRKGEDYSGNAFLFKNNQEKRISFGTDVDVQPGDLIIWRYNNEHAIDVVESRPDQNGFMRIIYPPEYVYPRLPLAPLMLSAAYRNKLAFSSITSWLNKRLDRSEDPTGKHAD